MTIKGIFIMGVRRVCLGRIPRKNLRGNTREFLRWYMNEIARRYIPVFQAIAVLSIVISSCDILNSNKDDPTWQSLGFSDKYAIKLDIEKDFLYVAAGRDGLWKINLESGNESWKYLGLGDNNLEKAPNSGVVDIDAVGDELLVAYNPIHLDTMDIGCFFSPDGGNNWVRSDSGIASEDFPYYYLFSAQRSLINPDLGYANNGSIFKTSNAGKNWYAITERGIYTQEIYLKWHSQICWFFGTSSFFAPILGYLDAIADTGRGFEMVKILPFVDNTCFDVTFDSTDPDVVYVGVFGMVIKTEDYGDTWKVPLFEHPQGGSFKAVEGHPTIHNLTFFAGGRTLFISHDGGKTHEVVNSPNDTQIFDMIFDKARNQLIMGTGNGIYIGRQFFN